MATHEPVHLSKHRLEGDLACTSLERLLDQCLRHQVNGSVRVRAGREVGTIELRLGGIESVWFAGARGDEALARLRALRDGSYEVSQRLPDLSGELGSAAEFWGEVADLSLIDLMRHCEANALSCTIAIDGGPHRGEIEYRAGEITDVRLDGVSDDEAILELLRLPDARFHVSAPPLDLAIEGWPAVRRAPTEPFHVGHLRERPAAADPRAPAAEPRPARADAPVVPRGALVLADGALARRGAAPESGSAPPRRSWVTRLRDRLRERLRASRRPPAPPRPALDAAGLDWVLGRLQAFLAARRHAPTRTTTRPPRRVPVLGRVRRLFARLLARAI